MTVDWKIARDSRQCAVTGAEIQVGDEHYSALIDSKEGFQRFDYSLAGWEQVDPATLFSFWRTRAQATEDKKPRLVIDAEAFYAFFASLEDHEEEDKQLFRYLVALILTRKRLLRLDDIAKGDSGDTLVLYDRRAEKTVRVPCPEVTQERLAEAQEMLNQIFECSLDDTEEL